nr:uncharacterized protein LOC112709345 [Arachis hypogaea]
MVFKRFDNGIQRFQIHCCCGPLTLLNNNVTYLAANRKPSVTSDRVCGFLFAFRASQEEEEEESGFALKGRNKTRFTISFLFLRAEHARPQPGKNPSRHHRRREEPCLQPSVTVRGWSPQVFVRQSEEFSKSLIFSLLFVTVVCRHLYSQGFVTKESLFVLLALSKSNPMFAVFFLARRSSSIGFVLLAVVLSPSPSRRTSFAR